LSNAARFSGDSKRADEYQQQAAAKQLAPMQDPASPQFIGTDLSKAQSAASSGRLEEALSLALGAIDRSSRAIDREQIAWQVPSVAATLMQKKATVAAQQLYDRLLAALESWAADAPQPVINATGQYARFLFSQRDRWSEVPNVLERYRNLQIAAHGADTTHGKEALQLALDFERRRNNPGAALRVAQDMLALEESLSGKTSQPYLNALQTLAHASDPDSALTIYLQRVAIADAAFSARDEIRAYTRVDAAQALARHRRFDEAEGLMDQAMVQAKNWSRQTITSFTQQREQIRQMRVRQQQASSAGIQR
jgi:hypothetical protein